MKKIKIINIFILLLLALYSIGATNLLAVSKEQLKQISDNFGKRKLVINKDRLNRATSFNLNPANANNRVVERIISLNTNESFSFADSRKSNDRNAGDIFYDGSFITIGPARINDFSIHPINVEYDQLNDASPFIHLVVDLMSGAWFRNGIVHCLRTQRDLWVKLVILERNANNIRFKYAINLEGGTSF